MTQREAIPFFVFKEHVFAEDDEDMHLFDRVVGTLRREGIYHESDLIFVGLRGARLYRDKTFGDKSRITGVHEDEARAEIERNPAALNNPVGMLVDAGPLPAIAVFNSTKLVPVGLRFVNESGDTVVQQDTVPEWGTIDGGSIDQAAVAVFFFQVPQSHR